MLELLELIVVYGFPVVLLNVIVISIFIKRWTNNFNNTDRGVKLFFALLIPLVVWMVLCMILLYVY